MDAERPSFAPGSFVDLRGCRWQVEQVTRHLDCDSIRLRSAEHGAAGSIRTFLLPFDRPSAVDRRSRIRVLGRRRYFEFLRDQILSSAPFGSLRTAAASGIDLQPFQLEPALAMLRHGRLRLFIADAVGLGKTIQAGLILTELAARLESFRALVVLPAGLRLQWRDELLHRFALHTTIADTRWLLTTSRELPPSVNPWTLPGVYLSSYDLLKQPEVLRPLEDVRWDLLVADEVHGAAPGTARLNALQALSRRSRRVVFLSATPPDGEPPAFDALADSGRFGGEGPITIFRRTRADAGYSGSRKTVLLPIRISAAERRMQHLLGRYTARVWTESVTRHDAAARLVAMVLRKRALSTAASLLASVRRRLALLSTGARAAEDQLRLPLFEEDPLPDDPDVAVLGAPGLADADAERLLLSSIERAAEVAALRESKILALQRLIRRSTEPLIVFTEYRDTVAQLARALWALQPLTLDGSMTVTERADVQRAFGQGARVLLATDAASEGLNLHERCRTIVHFELPWMPMRLEQRAGRVDRIGQRKKVHEIMLVARHTSERYVLGPLVRRIRAGASMSSSPVTSLAESSVASHVFGGALPEIAARSTAPPVEAMDLRHEAAEETRRILDLRRLSASGTRRGHAAGNETAICGGTFRNAATLIVRCRLESRGAVLAQDLLPLSLCWRLRIQPTTHADLRRLLAALASRLHSDLLANTGLAAWLERSSQAARDVLSQLSARERLLAELHQPRGLLQHGLFDARASRHTEARNRTATLLQEETATEVRRLDAATLYTSLDIVGLHPFESR